MSEQAPTFIDDLISNYSPKSLEFDVTLPMGEKLRFRAIEGYADLQSFRQAAKMFAQSAVGNKVYGECAPRTSEEAIAAFTIAQLSVEPKFDQRQACQIVRCAWLCDLIITAMDINRYAFLQKMAEGVESEKKDSLNLTENSPLPSGDGI